MFVTLVFESSLYMHCSQSEFINSGCSKWWGFCVICWQFLQWIICSSNDFHPAMPTQFCNLPYIIIIYWKLHMSCLKIFSYILQVFVWSVWCCTVSNFYHDHYVYIIYCTGGGFLFVCLSELQLMHIVELVSTGDGQIMETQDNVGIKLFVLAALKEH